MNTKLIIAEAAFRLLLDKGYRNTSMSDIVSLSKLSKGSIYFHFKNKEKLHNEVIEIYFLSYYKNLDFQKMEQLTLLEIEIILKDFYSSFTPKVMSISERGVSRHFILFFEAYEIHPTFRLEIREFYTKLNLLLELKFREEKIENPKIKSLALIAKYQGLLFWQSVFPEQKINEFLQNM